MAPQKKDDVLRILFILITASIQASIAHSWGEEGFLIADRVSESVVQPND